MECRLGSSKEKVGSKFVQVHIGVVGYKVGHDLQGHWVEVGRRAGQGPLDIGNPSFTHVNSPSPLNLQLSPGRTALLPSSRVIGALEEGVRATP